MMKATKLSTIAIAAGAVLGGSLMSGVAEAGSFSHGTKGARTRRDSLAVRMVGPISRGL
jgi:hypothetical protein